MRFDGTRSDPAAIRRCEGLRTRAFSLLELLVTLAIIASLTSILLPAMGSARRQAKAAVCGTRLRELGRAVQMYGHDYDDRLMPMAYWSFEIIETGPVIYWWGTNESAGVNHQRGFIWPYLQSPLGETSVFECPEQPWDSYKPQGAAKSITSTYGYNGYYLSPEHTPGWGWSIGHMPWLTSSNVKDPSRVFALADTLIDLGAPLPFNNALLDPPHLFTDGSWQTNPNPTTAFRHRRRTQAVHVDGHVDAYAAQPQWLTSRRFLIGAVGGDNAPHYVPNWRRWTQP